jgi:uncharacterized Ntn-hydrolase superfamily protein
VVTSDCRHFCAGVRSRPGAVARWLRAAVPLVALTSSATASATYSIVGSDRLTRQVGGAGTSCINGSDVYIIYGSVPGVAAVQAQAQFSQAGRERAVQLLGQGQSPEQVVAAITAPMFDGNAASRQYGVVDVTGRAAGFTGASTLDFADDVQGSIGSFTYSIQGNILTSSAVLSQAQAAFEAPACDLAARLMAALEAGADNGEGDSRCTGDGIPSDSAFLQVDLPDADAGSFLSLRVPTSGSDSPLTPLRAAFDEWRLTSPCPPPAPPDAGASDAASPGGAADAGASSTTPVATTPSPTEPSRPPALEAAAPEPPGASSAREPAPAPRSRGGCAVVQRPWASPTALFAAWLGIMGAAGWRRRSRASIPH